MGAANYTSEKNGSISERNVIILTQILVNEMNQTCKKLICRQTALSLFQSAFDYVVFRRPLSTSSSIVTAKLYLWCFTAADTVNNYLFYFSVFMVFTRNSKVLCLRED